MWCCTREWEEGAICADEAMKIPKKVKCGCFVYEVEFMEVIEHSGNTDILGLCISDENKILLKKSLKKTPQKLSEVFLHECMHMIEDCYNLPLGEKKVEALGMAIYDFLRNNKIEVHH